MKLYVVIGSPNCRKVLAAVNHLGIDVDIEVLSYFDGDLASEEYLALNLNGMVPTLVDDGFPLWESNAIMQYLADKVPGNSLFPQDAQTRADIHRWQCWELAHYNKALGVLSFEAVGKPQYMNAEPDKCAVEWSSASLARHAPVLEKHLQGRQYLVGDNITLADYSMIHVAQFKDAVPFDWSAFPNINSYYDRMTALPYWTATAPENLETIGRKPETALEQP